MHRTTQIYWRLSVPKIIDIGPDLLEIFENILGVRFFFETQCILCTAREVLTVNIGNILVKKILPISLAIFFYKSIDNMEAILKKLLPIVLQYFQYCNINNPAPWTQTYLETIVCKFGGNLATCLREVIGQHELCTSCSVYIVGTNWLQYFAPASGRSNKTETQRVSHVRSN